MSSSVGYRLIVLMVTVIVIVSSIPFTYGVPNCPAKCKCNVTIKCTRRELTAVPDMKKITAGPTTVDLSENDIEEIKSVSFSMKKLETLQSLLLSDNSILSIETGSFSSLPNLQYLDLSNNLLRHFPSEGIKKNSKLTNVNLSGNLFVSKTPELISDSLKILDLSFSKVSTFTKNNLKGLPSLQTLYLNANSLKHVDYNIFVGVGLKHVNLAHNSWHCNCDTIKLFDYLVKAEMTQISIDKPIQCMQRNKWYEDIYDSNGPIHYNKLCEKKLHRVSFTNSDAPIQNVHMTKEQNDTSIVSDDFQTIVELEILIVAVIIVLLVVLALVSLTILLRRPKTPKNHIYEELQNISINSRLSDSIFVKK